MLLRRWISRNRAVTLALASLMMLTACADSGEEDAAADSNDGATDDTAGDDETADEGAEDAEAADDEADEGPNDSAGEEITPRTIVYSMAITEEHSWADHTHDWADRVTELTDGAIDFEFHYGGSLCTLSEVNDCLLDGRTDMAHAAAAFAPASFPLANIGAIPFQTQDLQANATALRELYNGNEAIQAEFADANQKFLHVNPVNEPMLLSTEEIASIEDFDGLSVRFAGLGAPALEALGASPVAIDPSELYDSLRRGVVGGAVFPLDSHADFGLLEVGNYMYNLGHYMGSYSIMHVPIRLDLWEQLEPVVQEAFITASDEFAPIFMQDYHQVWDEQYCETVQEEGVEMAQLEPAEDFEAWADEWRESLMENWIATAEDAGVSNASEVTEEYRNLLEEHSDGPESYSAWDVCAGSAG